MKARGNSPRRSPAPGVVRDGEVYRLAELQRRLGWHEHALRQAKVAGLRIVRFGREGFVLGSDVLAFFRRLGDGASEKGPDGQTQEPSQDKAPAGVPRTES
jgi:hypothetical protein